MKILIVSAWENNESMYPHLRTVLDLLNENGIQAEYYQFFERGYSFASSLSCAKAFKLWKRVIKHLWLLKRFCDKNKFDKILVIDHFTYVCANFILPKNKLVFWSFDIMGDDSTYYKFSMGYPYDDPVRRLMWDDIYSSDVFGTTNTFKSRGTHIQHAGYDNTKFNNSNL